MSSLSDEQLQRYIRDSVRIDQREGTGDRQALMRGRYPDAKLGPVAKIEPEENNYRLSKEQLMQGRIVARITNEGTEEYPKLGLLPRSVTYWLVEGDYEKRQAVSWFVATDSATGKILRRFKGVLEPYEHGGYIYTQASARFFWVAQDEQGWVPCGSGCCRGYVQ